ncbi:TetR/AcrR family transcriptional regulator [Paractinoplanes toevensis]|uniref:TetR family transcriptional regulator n=1 Tax=Paractinoplanes toevensis TaxID=571911 RepID=A0A919T6J8_9ACTN|nr:TetR/AcrR family transcriptional regulator [Actinoplanes toevensis]GIM88951.1 TetR family transcriptional regulator [Actinoplanes toevensis]
MPSTRPIDKFDRRRDELAESALATLGAMGYARASLREIAGNSPFSHGVVHYYFDDKLELVIYSVRYYKARCVTRYDAVVRDSTLAEELVEAFAAKLAQTIREEAPMHRLWYDLRTQSMFEAPLREAITEIDGALEAMIWRVVERYAALTGRPPSVASPTAYAMLDGLFQQALLAFTAGGEPVLDGLATEVRAVLPLLVR